MKPLKFLPLLAIVFLGTFFLNSCGLGSYPPENEGAMITPDGKKIVQIYSIFYCTRYSSNGKSVSRSGTKTYYADIYDSENANKLNSKSFKILGNYYLKAVTNKSFMTYGYNQKKKKITLEIYDIESGKLRFNEDQLKELNKGLVFQYNYIYKNLTGKSGFVMKADDARVYLLDDLSGRASLLNDPENPDMIEDSNFNLSSSIELDSFKFQFKGNGRQKAILSRKKRSKKPEDEISSISDYIYPNLIENEIESDKSDIFNKKIKLFCADKDWLILSKTKDNLYYEWILTALDRETLKEKWSTVLKNPLADKKSEEIKQFYQSNNTLLVISTQSINKLDLKTGKWLWNLRLCNEIY